MCEKGPLGQKFCTLTKVCPAFSLTKGVDAVVQSVVENATVCKAHQHYLRAGRDHLVEIAQGGHRFASHLLGRGHVCNRVWVPIAHVVADQRIHDSQGKVGSLKGWSVDKLSCFLAFSVFLILDYRV